MTPERKAEIMTDFDSAGFTSALTRAQVRADFRELLAALESAEARERETFEANYRCETPGTPTRDQVDAAFDKWREGKG